ncbi:hypothetical protein ACHAWF_010118 [Thalassiosira exigua]
MSIVQRRRIHCIPTARLAAVLKRNIQTWAKRGSSDETLQSLAQLESNDLLSSIVNRFPPKIDYAFGYGSGVLRQKSEPSKSPSPAMIDIILATDNPYAWHKQNLQYHRDHYSMLARLGGPSFVTWLQENFGAKLYFHPFVNIDIDLGHRHGGDSQNEARTTETQNQNPGKRKIQRQIKYGIVSTDDLIQDLLDWEFLYLAGRMQKPTVPIDLPPKFDSSKEINEWTACRADAVEQAQKTNLLSAVSASLLLCATTDHPHALPAIPSIPIGELYNTIASLSYEGDIRMQAGAEDPNKVKKLVETPGMADLWENTYSESLDELQTLGLISVVDGTDNKEGGGCKRLECDFTNVAVRKQLVHNLPPRLRALSDCITGQRGSSVLRNELAKIVSPAAKGQSMKGFFTAGPVKSWRYALAKFSKGRLQT